jgi:hypothetical protein
MASSQLLQRAKLHGAQEVMGDANGDTIGAVMGGVGW